jgi:hypothetical protein
LPADAQYQRLSFVKVPKYFSTTIFPSFKMINALELLLPTKFVSESILSGHQPKVRGEIVSHPLPINGGKYVAWAFNETSIEKILKIKILFLIASRVSLFT